MKLCRISYALPPVLGGLEEHVAQLSIQQAQKGHEVHLVFSKGEPPRSPGIIPHQISVAERIGERSTRRKLRFMRAALATLRRLMREHEFCVIDAHGDFIEAGFIGALGKISGVPTVLTIHGGLSERALVRLASRTSFDLVTHLIAVSNSICGQLLRRGVKREKISVISSGVDLKRFSQSATRQNRPETAREEIVLFVGRLHRVKGVDVLLDAAARLRAERPDTRFVIVGDGPEMTRLRGPAQGSRNVTFAGALQPNDVDAWLARASVFVMPSIGLAGQSEGLPRAVMEAMAAGLPIVASRTGGIPEIVQDGKGGLLVQPSDADALARALIEILSHPMKAKAMGAYNRAAIESRSFPRVEQQVTQLFERLAKK